MYQLPKDYYPRKDLRLQQLEDHGFNVADWVCFPPGQFNPEALRLFFEKHSKISCRHFHEDEGKYFKSPFKFGVSTLEEAVAFCTEHNVRFWTLCNEFLPPEEFGFTGNITLLDNREYTVEYFEGCHSPRQIESMSAGELRTFKREFGRPLPEDAPRPLVEVAGRFGRFFPEIRPIILEFNIYPYPVGRQRRPEVFWEWRLG